MLEFATAFAAFLAAHVIPAAFGLRERMIAAVGRRMYMFGYSAISVGLLAWLIWAAQRAPYIELWPPSRWRHAVPLVVMPFALMLLGAAAAAFLLWSASHLVANGDFVSAILFGTLALFSVQGMLALDRRSRKKLGEQEWSNLANRSPAVPFNAPLRGRVRAADLAGALAGLGVYATMLADAHERLFGVAPVWR
jgi:uncharacterized membrane protein